MPFIPGKITLAIMKKIFFYFIFFCLLFLALLAAEGFMRIFTKNTYYLFNHQFWKLEPHTNLFGQHDGKKEIVLFHPRGNQTTARNLNKTFPDSLPPRKNESLNGLKRRLRTIRLLLDFARHVLAGEPAFPPLRIASEWPVLVGYVSLRCRQLTVLHGGRCT